MWLPDELDASGLIAVVERAAPSRTNLEEALRLLDRLAHRAGALEGGAPGSGILTDLPRELWAERLGQPEAVQAPGFFVGHLFFPDPGRDWSRRVEDALAAAGAQVLWSKPGEVLEAPAGTSGGNADLVFWQVAGLLPGPGPDARLFELSLELEDRLGVHVLSLSRQQVAYKAACGPEALARTYAELAHPLFRTRATIAHTQTSSGSVARLGRLQPCRILAHCGALSTAAALRDEAMSLNVPLQREAGPSQTLDRLLGALLHRFGLDLVEALHMLFPPVPSEVSRMAPDLQDLFVFSRQALGPVVQGPAALVARAGSWLVALVDALGFKPLWLLETEDRWLFSSEPGVVPLDDLTTDPKPLAPGEKVAIRLDGPGAALLDAGAAVIHALAQARARHWPLAGRRCDLREAAPVREPGPASGAPAASSPAGGEDLAPALPGPAEAARLQALFGFSDDDVEVLEAMAATGAEPIGSLGYDGPLAALAPESGNVADFLKEDVAGVTHPAIDREREAEHFSTRALLGARPLPGGSDGGPLVELQLPLLLPADPPGEARWEALAGQHGTLTERGLACAFRALGGRCRRLPFGLWPAESPQERLAALADAAVQAAREGATVLILDDRLLVPHRAAPLDPHVALAWVDRALREARGGAFSLRRRVGLVLASGGLRNLHDIMLALGLGADAVLPYLLWAGAAPLPDGPAHLLAALRKGMEKVLSTLGIHDVRGYRRAAAAIGLSEELARILDVPAFGGKAEGGWDLEAFARKARERWSRFQAGEPPRPARTYHIYPKLWKAAAQAAASGEAYPAYEAKVRELELAQPVSLRHLLEVRPAAHGEGQPVDLSAGRHALPFVISSMSFGSQNEVAYRAYAEAAYRLDILAFNGEGGELPDLVGRYPDHRGIQIASGRFGINVEMLNGTRYVEIKIGQGAKPGEGGHLPGSKVTAKVALARRARPGVDLISPSNSHDLYSIEDLAQLIAELKTINPGVEVAVKVAVGPAIGPVAVAIARAGADAVVISGFDGGTGAARRHAIRHVGLPAELGVRLAHQALVEAGLRERVELWADGGVRSAQDVLKLILLGANRVGFGTLAMVAIGCTVCRGCQLDTCHVGIATQIEDLDEARRRGLKRFAPRELDLAVEHLVSFFKGMGQELARLAAPLGAPRLQDLVGRSDLLIQARGHDRVDLTALLEPALPVPGPARVRPASVVPFQNGNGRVAVAAVSTLRTVRLTEAARSAFAGGLDRVTLTEPAVAACDRMLGSHLAGSLAREQLFGRNGRPKEASLLFNHGSLAGNGFASFNREGLTLRIRGGVQDGSAKSASGGRVVVLKGKNRHGRWVGGTVGKSFGYGAQKGLLIVQGDADSRFCVRLSGADVVAGGRPHGRAAGGAGIAARANLKGFAFEYMTGGRAVVLGDPGPWMCSGMTGGVVYLLRQPELGLDEAAFRERLAQGAKVQLLPAGPPDLASLQELLGAYREELEQAGQHDEASWVRALLEDPLPRFLKVVPEGFQADSDISTE